MLTDSAHFLELINFYEITHTIYLDSKHFFNNKKEQNQPTFVLCSKTHLKYYTKTKTKTLEFAIVCQFRSTVSKHIQQ